MLALVACLPVPSRTAEGLRSCPSLRPYNLLAESLHACNKRHAFVSLLTETCSLKEVWLILAAGTGGGRAPQGGGSAGVGAGAAAEAGGRGG